MVIQIDGGSSYNQGAQLMLIAVLDQISRYYPGATIYTTGEPKIDVCHRYESLTFKVTRSELATNIIRNLYLENIARRFSHSLYYSLNFYHAIKGVDVLFDIRGFQFGDPWPHDRYSLGHRDYYYSHLKKNGTKIILLPQAFGPFNQKGSQRMVSILDKNIDLAYARDKTSFDYMAAAGFSTEHLLLYPDFTSLVNGETSDEARQNAGKVCFIPNSKIISEKVLSEDEYVNAFAQLIEEVYISGKEAFLLNHEGRQDEILCQKIKQKVQRPMNIVSGLDVLQTKGVISSSQLVVSSRFHGVANALSSVVPCLATSWSHKYQMLMEDYHQENTIIDLNNSEASIQTLKQYLNDENHHEICHTLRKAKEGVCEQNRIMWESTIEWINNYA